MRIKAISIILLATTLVGIAFLMIPKKRTIPKNVKSFLYDYSKGNIPDMDSIGSWGITEDAGPIPGKHYYRSKLVNRHDSIFTFINCHINLDLTNDTIISIRTCKCVFITDTLLHIKNRMIADTNLSELERNNYAVFLKLKSKYGLDEFYSPIDNSSSQFLFRTGRLYYKWFPPVSRKIYRYEYWAFPRIKINDDWLYCPY